MKRLAIIGSGDLAQQMIHHAKASGRYLPVCLFDDFATIGEAKFGLSVVGAISDVTTIYNDGLFDEIIIGIGYKHMLKREEIYNTFSRKIPFGTIIHSSCIIDMSCKIGEGSILFPGVIADMNVQIGHNTIIYNSCVIAHDSRVGNHAILSPCVSIAGFSDTGDKAILGIGTIVSDNVKLCNNVQTGAATVVLKSINEQGVYVGCPAKFLHK